MQIINKSKIVPIDQVENWSGNPRAIHPKDLERLKKQITELGTYKPLICEKEDGKYITIGGNMRLKALKELGAKTAWMVLIKSKDETERIKISLSDNDRAGYYQEQKLWDQIKNIEINLLDYKIETRIPKFDLSILKDKFLEGQIGEDDIPEITGPVKTKTGDIYEMDKHRLICGSATDKESFRKLLGKERAQMTFTDPPYNVAYKGTMNKARREILNDDTDPAKFYKLLAGSLNNIFEYTTGGAYICMGWSGIDVLKTAFQNTGGHVSSIVVWAKNCITIGRGDYQNKHELILYGWHEKVKNHYFIFSRDKANVWKSTKEFKTRWNGTETIIELPDHTIKIKGQIEGTILAEEKKMDLWFYNRPTKSPDHPTQKPVELITEAIINSSRQGDGVLDCFNGSGSTLIACEKAGRRFYGIELDPFYIETAVRRWELFTGKKSKKQGEKK